MFSNRLSDRILSFVALPLFPFYILSRYKSFAIFLLILVISISPRIHIGTLQYGKLLDLRYEDFLIIILTFSWFLYSSFRRKKLYISPLGKPILLYLLLAFVSTLIGLFFGWIKLTRAFFFYFKEVEYFLMFFITVNLIEDRQNVKIAFSAFLIGGLLNGLYVLYQLITGNIGSMKDTTSIYRYYGFSMIGESISGATGNYFSLILFISIALLILLSSKTIKPILIICIVLSVLGLIGSMNRSSIWGTVLIFPVYLYCLVFLTQVKLNKIKLFASLLFLFILVLFSGKTFLDRMKLLTPSIMRITAVDNAMDKYRVERIENVYTDYLKVIAMNPLTGLGKSITGQQAITGIDLGHFYGEAHNYYLRIIIEMGIVGLLMFLYLMSLILKLSYLVLKYGFSHFDQAIGLVCFIYTSFLMLSSISQDVFITARIAELFWILVGLLVVIFKNKEKGDQNPSSGSEYFNEPEG